VSGDGDDVTITGTKPPHVPTKVGDVSVHVKPLQCMAYSTSRGTRAPVRRALLSCSSSACKRGCHRTGAGTF
jgi:hypothetical protein